MKCFKDKAMYKDLKIDVMCSLLAEGVDRRQVVRRALQQPSLLDVSAALCCSE